MDYADVWKYIFVLGIAAVVVIHFFPIKDALPQFPVLTISPPESYQPQLTGTVGDFLYAVTFIFQSVYAVVSIVPSILSALGVPYVWAWAINTLLIMGLAVWVVRVVSGRRI